MRNFIGTSVLNFFSQWATLWNVVMNAFFSFFFLGFTFVKVALVATFGWKQLLQIHSWLSCGGVRFMGCVCVCVCVCVVFGGVVVSLACLVLHRLVSCCISIYFGGTSLTNLYEVVNALVVFRWDFYIIFAIISLHNFSIVSYDSLKENTPRFNVTLIIYLTNT